MSTSQEVTHIEQNFIVKLSKNEGKELTRTSQLDKNISKFKFNNNKITMGFKIVLGVKWSPENR